MPTYFNKSHIQHESHSLKHIPSINVIAIGNVLEGDIFMQGKISFSSASL